MDGWMDGWIDRLDGSMIGRTWTKARQVVAADIIQHEPRKAENNPSCIDRLDGLMTTKTHWDQLLAYARVGHGWLQSSGRV